MTGDNSCSQGERWRLLRLLYESHGVDLDAISLISGIELDAIIDRSCRELWQARKKQKSAKSKPVADTPENLRAANAKTAKQITTFLRRMLREETKRSACEGSDSDAQVKTRNVLAMAKGVMTIEEIITSLDKLTDAASQYPQDALEFHRRLERQIEAIANPAGAAGIHQPS